MEFKYHANQNKRTSPMTHPLSTVTDVSGNSLEGSEFVLGGFPGNVPTPNVFPTPVPINADEVLRRELEKERIRREIFKSEMAMAGRRELEEEVRREMASENALGILLGISFRERVSIIGDMSFNPILRHYQDNNINVFGVRQSKLEPQVHIKRLRLNNDKNMFTLQAKSDVCHYGTKHNVVPSPTIDDNNNSPLVLSKKPKLEWSCALCQITTTSEKGLNDHLQGKRSISEMLAN